MRAVTVHDLGPWLGRLSVRLAPDELWELVEPLISQFTPRPGGDGTAPVDRSGRVSPRSCTCRPQWLCLTGSCRRVSACVRRAGRSPPLHRLDQGEPVAHPAPPCAGPPATLDMESSEKLGP